MNIITYDIIQKTSDFFIVRKKVDDKLTSEYIVDVAQNHCDCDAYHYSKTDNKICKHVKMCQGIINAKDD